MISRNSDNFIVRHYDWVVAGVGALALLGGVAFYVCTWGTDADEAAADAVRVIDRRKPADCGAEKADLTAFEMELRKAKNPKLVSKIEDPTAENFLASERRLKCKCGAVLVNDPARVNCPKCGAVLVVVNKVDEEAKKADAWKKKYGVDIDDTDKDGDGFSNREEFAAGTDPTNAREHDDYFASLALQLPLQETFVPFVLTKATPLPKGWRCEFFDPKRKDDYGRWGRTFTATVGSDIVVPTTNRGITKNEPTGYVLKKFEKKEELRAITAGSTMKKSVDVSVATLERKTDGKAVKLVMQSAKKNARLTPVDVQAKLVYTRMGTKTFDVIVGGEINLNGTKYRVKAIRRVGKGAEVDFENGFTGKIQTLKASQE